MRNLFLLTLIALLPCAAGLRARGRHPLIRLATWNLHNLCDDKNDHWDDPVMEPWEVQEKLNRLVRVIRPLKAQVLAVQDVEKKHLVQRLACGAGYPFCVALEGRRGLGLLSQYPIKGYKLVADGRCLEVHIEGPLPLVVMVCHLFNEGQEIQAWKVATRAWQLQRQNPGCLIAVAGDLEAPWRQATLDPLRQVGMADPFTSLPYEDRCTSELEERPVVADHLLLNRGLAWCMVPGTAQVHKRRTVEATSDHFPLLVELREPGEERDEPRPRAHRSRGSL